MMFFPEIRVLAIAQKQFCFKLKANIGLMSTMIALQAVAVLFSLTGTGQMGISSNYINLSVNYISNQLIVIFTAAWAFYMAILLTTKSYRNIDFAFVANRITSNLANIGLLFTYSLIGGLTSVLTGVLLRVIGYFYFGSTNIVGQTFFITSWELLIGFMAATFYILLMSAIGYFIGVLAQLSQVFSFLVPALLFGTLIFESRSGAAGIVLEAIKFFINEGSLSIFAFKIMTFVLILFVTAINLSNRLEVRK